MADEVAELQLFVEIVRAGNLSAAARALKSSPAAMSRGMTALESRLGVRLVTRTSRSFELAGGLVFIAAAKDQPVLRLSRIRLTRLHTALSDQLS
jgi:DNA-binding transcriptional LysR family regulator